jgi:hypothetical protein
MRQTFEKLMDKIAESLSRIFGLILVLYAILFFITSIFVTVVLRAPIQTELIFMNFTTPFIILEGIGFLWIGNALKTKTLCPF